MHYHFEIFHLPLAANLAKAANLMSYLMIYLKSISVGVDSFVNLEIQST